MKLATWNIVSGTGSFTYKTGTFEKWCASVQPDLLMLQEVHQNFLVGAKGKAPLEVSTGMRVINFVNTLDKNDGETAKCLVGLCKPGMEGYFTSAALQFPGLEARRRLLKLATRIGGTLFSFWNIHADASQKGGAAATGAAADYLAAETKAGNRTLVAGDFNYDLGKVKYANRKTALRFDGKALAFSQWTATFGAKMDKAAQQTDFGLTRNFYNGTLKPNALLDYAMYADGVKVTPEKNCPDEALWQGIVTQFDHCPTLFTIA